MELFSRDVVARHEGAMAIGGVFPAGDLRHENLEPGTFLLVAQGGVHFRVIVHVVDGSELPEIVIVCIFPY